MIDRLIVVLMVLAGSWAWAQMAPLQADLQPADPDSLWQATNSHVEVVGDLYRWHLETGKSAELAIRQDHPLLQQLRYYDFATFEVRLAIGEVSSMSMLMLGHVSGPRQYKVHDFQVAILTTEKENWLRRCYELARPNWFPWDNPDGQGVDTFLRFTAVGLSPDTVIELRGLSLTRGVVRLKPDFLPPITWPVLSRDEAGNAVYTLQHQLINQANLPVDIEAEIISTHERFAVSLDKAVEENVKNGKTATFTITATMSMANEAAVADLYSEPLTLRFRPAHAPDATIIWQGDLVRPLSASVNRQVLLAEEDLAFIREKLPEDERLRGIIKPNKAIAGADAFLEKELLRIPTGHLHVSNNWVGAWRPAERMPEIVNTETGEREFDTVIAGRTWKEYMGHRGGAMGDLTNAYLFTGDEKYAQKAIELFELYAKQYTSLAWGDMFSPSFSQGDVLLSGSRVALTSTYGTNWYFKDHCRLLSAIAESPSWTDEQRQSVYQGFVLPYVTELMKFRGGISNMTDITNHNILLLGLAFRDAGLVRWSLYSDPGLLRRLLDITPDGFSSEGRPLNYHHAAMSEYLPALAFLDNAKLVADFPRERLLAAIRMPYQRANLEGYVPNSGDVARGFRVGKRAEADWLVGMFPQEEWLFDLGNLSTIQAQLSAYRSNRQPDANAWQALIETEPRLFDDAGYAILRTGTTADEQVMATLDYGRNPMHAHLDRNTISLSAFGHLYTQGPGTLYNVGSGGMTRNQQLDPTVRSGSLSQNVVLVDQQDQQPAVGSLLKGQVEGEMQVAASRVPGIRPGVDHTRVVALKDGIVVVLDKLESSEKHVYDFVYHNFGDLTIGDWQATPVTERLGSSSHYESIIEPRQLRGEGPIHLQWQVAEDAHLALWRVPGGEVYTATMGLNNMQTRMIPQAAPTLIHRVEGQTVYGLMILEPYRTAPRVTGIEAAGASGLTVKLVDGTSFTIDLEKVLQTP